MNVSRTGRRLAVSGIATAIAAAGLVGTTGVAADAATATTTYSCAFPLGGAQDVPVTVDAAALDAIDSVQAGQPVPAGLLNTNLAMTLPATIASTLTTVGLSSISSKDLAMTFGSAKVPVTGLAVAGAPVANPDGSAVVNATATNGAFSAPAAAADPEAVAMPKAFNMVVSTLHAGDLPVACTATGTPVVLKTVTVTKNSSTTAVKAPAKVKKGAVAKLVASVQGGFNAATGKVSFFDGAKKLGTSTVKGGKATYAAKGLKVGKHTITAKYAGDGFRNASKSKAVAVKVVK